LGVLLHSTSSHMIQKTTPPCSLSHADATYPSSLFFSFCARSKTVATTTINLA